MKPLKQLPPQNSTSAADSRTTAAPLIYAVDDEEILTELYALVLEGAGYIVRGFNDRAAVLAALAAETRRPNLLIMDYLGDAMPVDQFIQHCLGMHPPLRILMASAFHQTDVYFPHARPDRFIQKPFTPEELRQEVTAALAA